MRSSDTAPDPVPVRRGCRVVVAAAGYGKSTALRRWFGATGTHWHRLPGPPAPGALRDAVGAAARAGVRLVVVDDLPRLPRDAVDDLVDTVDSTPGVSVVLSSRWPQPPPAARHLGRALWTQVGPADLALTVEQVAEVLRDGYGRSDPDLADRVHEATAGWPALVHLAVETLRADGDPSGPLVPALTEPGGPVAAYVAEEVLGALPAAAVRLIRTVGDLAPVTGDLCDALGVRGARDAVRLLSRVGIVTRSGPPVPGLPAVARIVPVVVEVSRHGQRRSAARRAADAAAAGAWYRDHGPPVAAARAFRTAGDDAACVAVLEEHGAAMVARGHADAVVELTADLPESLRTRALRLVRGDALRTVGEVDAAARVYGEVADAEPRWDAGLAWRMGRIAYQRGDARAALAAFARATAPRAAASADTDARRSAAPTDAAPTDATDAAGRPDVALLLAWTAHAHLLAGDVTAATASARRAVDVAAAAGDDPALATAQVSLALCLGVAGDDAGSEERYGLASAIAERTGDIVLLSRVFTNRAHRLLRTARYADGLDAARRAVRYATTAGYPSVAALAVNNEAVALTMLGRFDEAVRRYEWALARFHRMGSRRLGWARVGLADVYRRRGWREQARGAYEEAVRVADGSANAHVLTEALAGLALVVLDEDPQAAAGFAERAVAEAATELQLPALLARGWVALRARDPAGAAKFVDEAARVARAQGDLAGVADALELRAATETDPTRVRASLREAHAIWAAAGAVVEAARIRVLLGRRPGADADDRLGGVVAAAQLAAADATTDRPGDAALAGPGGPGGSGGPAGGAVEVRALGRFEVHVDGQPVPASQWQSRKARDLVKILVARRGRPVPRGELCELLWPDDDPRRTGHRLSVLLSIVRGVLDPAKVFPADHYLAADAASIALDLSRLRVDVVDFLAHVTHGRRLAETGAWAEARTVLRAADALYRAEAFEDEPYADWSGPFREEVRAAHLGMLRALARAEQAVSGADAAVGHLLRLLEHDPFDEPGHRALVRALVAAGRHGEARRAFDRYAAAMRTIDVRPPDEVLLRPARTASP